MRYRVVNQRASTARIGIQDEESERLEAATDEDGVIHLEDAYGVPPASENDSNVSTVLNIMDHRGLSDERIYRKEYMLRATHQLMITGASTSQISQKLNISLTEARSLKKELAARQINEMKSLDKHKVAGQAIMFYDHIMAKSLQIVGRADPLDKLLRHKVEALKVALQAQTDKQKFLMISHYWDNGLNNAKDITDKHVEGANDIRNIMDAVLTGDTYEVVTDEDEHEDDIEIL